MLNMCMIVSCNIFNLHLHRQNILFPWCSAINALQPVRDRFIGIIKVGGYNGMDRQGLNSPFQLVDDVGPLQIHNL